MESHSRYYGCDILEDRSSVIRYIAVIPGGVILRDMSLGGLRLQIRMELARRGYR